MPVPSRQASGAAIALVLALIPLPARSQTPGLPLFAGGAVPGVAVGADVGLAPEGSTVGRATTVTGSLELATRHLGLRLSAGLLDPGGRSADPAGGVLGSVRVLAGGVESPLSIDLLGGYGVHDGPEATSRHALAAAAFILTIPTPVVSLRPWLAPRVDWRSKRPPGGTGLDSAVGGSAGVDLRFLGGLVLRAAWDKVEGADRLIGFGAAYHF